jgi:predicted MFS family arabinose efflux permease
VRQPRERDRTGLGQARQVIASIAVSGFGTWGYNVGIAVYTYERTHSAGWVAAVTVGRYVPALVLSWLAGRLVDRLPRRALAVTGDLGCAAIMVLLAVLGALDAPIWAMTLVAAVSSTLARIQAAALLTLAADVVVESRLVRASVLAGAWEAIATAAGSATASVVLLHFTAPTLFLVNAISFAVSAILIGNVRSVRRVRAAVSPSPGVLGRSPRRAAGVVFWPLQATRALAATVYGVDVVLLTVIASRQLHAGTSGYGWLLSAAGVGGLTAVLPSRRDHRRSTATIASIGLIGYALPLMIFALGPPLGGGIPVQVLRGLGSVLVTSTVISGLQRSVPSAMAGRVFALTQSLVLAGTCAGAVIAPVLLEVAGFKPTLVICAAVPVAVQLVLFPFLVRFDRQEESLLAALDPRVTTLRGLDLLRAASRSTLYEIADGIVELSVEAGQVVVREGDHSDALYVIVSGAAEATGHGREGPVRLRSMRAPDYFGEIGVLRGVPRTATVSAITPMVLWRIPADVFAAAVSEAGVSGALTDTVQIRFQTTATNQRPLVPSTGYVVESTANPPQ